MNIQDLVELQIYVFEERLNKSSCSVRHVMTYLHTGSKHLDCVGGTAFFDPNSHFEQNETNKQPPTPNTLKSLNRLASPRGWLVVIKPGTHLVLLYVTIS